ncbi:trypsin-like cysteine/serine peptidase domain-containing protein [Aspergillus pseudoustus]|uniref:Trypsin-like cysteine/serine peptidase domain-containing protein n=1 Tax=Aspergillus pseudoustus TaxID=1810923 RepID=A0ABR4IZP0_9EURO
MHSLFISLPLLLATAAHAAKSIIGGTEVRIEDYPYQVMVFIWDTVCGSGIIIDETHILTAGHVISGGNVHHFSIRAGSATWAEGGQLVNVSTVTKHPDYFQPEFFDNDIAILTLAEKLVWGPTIQPIALAPGPCLNNTDTEPSGVALRPAADTAVRISGWGAAYQGGPLEPTLRSLTVNVINQTECVAIYASFVAKVTDAMFCAGVMEGGKGSCQGDSGGPVVDAEDGVLVGIVSWGRGCAQPGWPSVYVRVAYHREWIKKLAGV